ncbi:MAG: hypothetical protein GX119_10605 [Syntrophomonadaceae bacterium]|nr:hypothetical protein [Syntrophomonadaceae bacterium]
MKLNLVYENNKSGQRLLEAIKSRYQEASWDEFMLEEDPYLHIFLDNGRTADVRTINTPQAIKRCSDRDKLVSIMKSNGINAGVEESAASKIYEVLVFDMKIIFIRQKVGSKSGNKIRYMRENQKTKVAEIAKKALLLSGLDVALIRIQLNSRKRLQFIFAESSPGLRDKDISVLLDELDRIYNYKKKEVKLGADPEFMIINNRTGKLVSASHFFPVQGLVGCDNIRLPNRQQRPIAELRPKPEKSPLQLAANIRYALVRASSMAAYSNVKWVAGSHPVSGYSIGGHIHFSNVELNAALMRALDNYLGLLVFLIEKPHTACKRRKKYGLLGEYREKSYGGFEYRTPGSWLMSQKIAMGVLCLAKIVASNYMQLPNNYLNTAEAQEAFYSGNRDYFVQDFDQMWRDIERTQLYPKYAEEIDIIRWMIINDMQWDEKMDIRKGWNISNASRRNSKAALSNSRQSQDGSRVPNSNSNSPASGNRSPERRNSGRTSRTRRSSGSGRRNLSNSNMDNISRNTLVIATPSLPASIPIAQGTAGRIVASGGVRRAISCS